MPWVTLAIGDYGVKVAIALVMLGPWWWAVNGSAGNEDVRRG
jgi:hypothetical protein